MSSSELACTRCGSDPGRFRCPVTDGVDEPAACTSYMAVPGAVAALEEARGAFLLDRRHIVPDPAPEVVMDTSGQRLADHDITESETGDGWVFTDAESGDERVIGPTMADATAWLDAEFPPEGQVPEGGDAWAVLRNIVEGWRQFAIVGHDRVRADAYRLVLGRIDAMAPPASPPVEGEAQALAKVRAKVADWHYEEARTAKTHGLWFGRDQAKHDAELYARVLAEIDALASPGAAGGGAAGSASPFVHPALSPEGGKHG